MSNLSYIYNKLTSFYKNNSIESIIKNNCQVQFINKKENIDLTVIFTSNNRPEQTYFTIKSYNSIAVLNNINIQIIIVEDTEGSNKININELNFDYSNIEITYIYINKKTWVNPCLNYNIGFKYIKSDYVIITNAEVCVFGDIYNKIKNTLTEENYLVFDVFEMGSSHCTTNLNTDVWENCDDFKYETVINFIKTKSIFWLQSINNNRQFHFLTCIHNKSLQKIDGFDNDFMFNVDCDDINFLDKIKLFLKLKVINFYHNEHNVLGFHQFHSKHNSDYYNNNNVRIYNQLLYQLKHNYILKTNKYINLIDYKDYEELDKAIN